jgi:hypothetical protein
LDLLTADWFFETPIDFEYKKYKMLAYLKKVDSNYYIRKFSPWLLNNEKFIVDIERIMCNIKSFEDSISKEKIIFNDFSLKIVNVKPIPFKEVEIIEEMVDFTIPLLKISNGLGLKIWDGGPEILW